MNKEWMQNLIAKDPRLFWISRSLVENNERRARAWREHFLVLAGRDTGGFADESVN